MFMQGAMVLLALVCRYGGFLPQPWQAMVVGVFGLGLN
jgi:hypothetical protein